MRHVRQDDTRVSERLHADRNRETCGPFVGHKRCKPREKEIADRKSAGVCLIEEVADLIRQHRLAIVDYVVLGNG